MQSSDRQFQEFVMKFVCDNGGTRMQVTMSEIAKYAQSSLDAKDNVNLYRKQYGNIEQCMKQISKAIFIIDSMVIRLKGYQEIESFYKQQVIGAECFAYYQNQYKINEEKIKEVLYLHKEDICKHCKEQYKIMFNSNKCCAFSNSTHTGTYNIQ